MEIRKVFIFLLVPMILASCMGSFEPNEFYAHVNNPDKGFSSVISINEIHYSAQYRPKEFMALTELKGETFSSELLDSVSNTYADGTYFNIKLSSDSKTSPMLKYGIASEQDYYDRIRFFSSEFQRNIKLVNGDDTTYCDFSHFERSYGISPDISILCHFPTNQQKIAGALHLNEPFFSSGETIEIALPKAAKEIKDYKIKSSN
jgi:hypothetical protein